jgi:uncharacterized membrane protein HdeD (DUF308 family)
MYGWLFAFMYYFGMVLLFAGVMEVLVIKRAKSWKVGGVCLLIGTILVAVSVLVERSILGL